MRPNKSLLGNFSSESSQIYLVRKLTAKMKLFYYLLLINATSAKSPSNVELCQKPRLCERCGRMIIYQKGTHQSRRFCRKIVDMPCCANKVFSFAFELSITVFSYRSTGLESNHSYVSTSTKTIFLSCKTMPNEENKLRSATRK